MNSVRGPKIVRSAGGWVDQIVMKRFYTIVVGIFLKGRVLSYISFFTNINLSFASSSNI